GGGGSVILPNVPMQFDATQSHDPESDDITYHWDFGDGTTSDNARPVHVFGAAGSDVTVQLSVSDGQLDGTDKVKMLGVPTICATCTPGIINLKATSALEFGGGPGGQRAPPPFTVPNTDKKP